MKRRGVLTVVMAMELIFIAVLLILFGSMATYGTDKGKTQELLIAEDLALTLDTMQSIPFDFEYEYETNLIGKNITINGNQIGVTDKLETDSLARALFSARTFSKLTGAIFPTKQTLQGSLLKIRKFNNEFTFTDQGGSKATHYIATAKRTKDELLVQVSYVASQNQGQNQILQNLKDRTEAELRTQGFAIEQTTKANTYIIFSFANQTANNGQQHRITYSLAQQGEVQYLAEQFAQGLDSRLSLPILVSPKSYQNKPTVGLAFLNTQTSIAELNNDAKQNIIALTIAGYFEQIYKEATP